MRKNNTGTMRDLIRDSLYNAMSYYEYRKLVDEFAKLGKTTGNEQQESLINYTQLNSKRMKRWDKTFKLPDSAKERIEKSKE